MKKYIINLQEQYDGEFLPEIMFECYADDADHAIEQAEEAYPECKINTFQLCMLFGDLLIGDRFFDPNCDGDWIKVDFTKAYRVSGSIHGLYDFNENDEVCIINDYRDESKLI